MDSPPAPPTTPEPVELGAPVAVLCVDDDPHYLTLVSYRLTDENGLEVVTKTDPETALDHLDEVDCVVCDFQMPGLDGHDVLDAVRATDDSLPYVLLSTHDEDRVVEPVLSEPWTDYLPKEAVATTEGLLARRVRSLVQHRRCALAAQRAFTALEVARDGVGIAAPDGSFAFADRTFERRFGRDADGLVGVPWRELFTPEEVARIEDTRLEAVEDGWQWSGNCDALRADGSRVSVPTTVSGLADGSLVFAVTADG